MTNAEPNLKPSWVIKTFFPVPPFRTRDTNHTQRDTDQFVEHDAQSLQLGLLGLGSQVGHEHVAQVIGSLVQEVAHAVSAETFADDVEVQTGPSQYVMFEGTIDEEDCGLTCSR